VFGANPDEAELPLADYPTFEEFFARRLRAGARAACNDASDVCAPTDGVVSACGAVSDGMMLQAKGHSYRLGDLLADDEAAAKMAEGQYLTVYLSPRDYHRVHAPLAGTIEGYRHVPGHLWPGT